jgi:hypothetical protein
MEHARAHHGTARGRPAILLLAVVAAILVTAPAAAAGPRGEIFDWAATPSWTSTLTGGGAAFEGAYGVVALPGDSCLVSGSLAGPAGDTDISLTKYRGSTRLWTKLWAGRSGSDGSGQAALSADGRSVFVAGTSDTSPTSAKLVLLKRSVTNGRLLWAKAYSPPEGVAYPTAIAVDAAGNVTVAAQVIATGGIDSLVARWTSGGARKWVWRYDATGVSSDSLTDVLPGPNGSAYVAGEAFLTGGPPFEASLVARLSATGRPVWVDRYIGASIIGAAAISLAARPGGGIYAAGAIGSLTDATGLILSYSPRGRRSQFVLDTGPAGTSRVYMDVAVTSTNAVVAVGRSGATSVNSDCYVATWTPDGSALGSIALPGAFDRDQLDDVAVDAFGGFYAAGKYYAAADDPEILTLRGSVTTGGGGFVSLWRPAVSTQNSAEAIAVSGVTAYVVGSYQSGTPTGMDQFLLAYRY